MLKNKKILVTGATGQVARPIAEALAKDNEVWCAARFSDPKARTELEAAGCKTIKWSLEDSNFDGMPDDFNYVVHSAAAILEVSDEYDKAIGWNAEGSGLLMQHCRKAEAFLHISSLIVYKSPKDINDRADERTGALGCNPSAARTYSVLKIATEGSVRTMCRALNLPTTIARLGLVYGTSGHGGLPSIFMRAILAGQPMLQQPRKLYSAPISEADVIAHIEPLLKAATVPANIINWASDEVVERQEMYDYLAEVSGVEVKFQQGDAEFGDVGGLPDVSRLKALAGPFKTKWRDGVLETLKANFPDHKFKDKAPQP